MNNPIIKSRITIIMAVLVLIIIAAAAAIIINRVSELQTRTMESAAERLENNVAMIDLVFAQMMTYSWAMLDAVHALPQVQGAIRGGSREEANAALNGLLKVNIDVGGFNVYNNLLVFDSNFDILSSANPTGIGNARTSPYASYLSIAERGQSWASNVTISSVTGLSQIWIAKPFMDGNTFRGMAAIPLNIQGLPYFLGTEEYQTGSYYTAIADSTGIVAYSNRLEYLGKSLVEMNVTPGMDQLRRGRMFEYTSVVSGNRDLAYLAVSSEMSWMIISGIDRASVVPALSEIIMSVLPFVLGLLALGIVMFLVVFRTLTALERLAHTLNDIANGEGDLTAKLSESGTKEIANVSKYFNQTIGKIRDLVILIKKQSETLHGIGDNLGSNMDKTFDAVCQIVINVKNVKNRITNQNASVCETHLTMEELVENIGKLNVHIETQSNEVNQASSSIEEMVSSIQSVTRTLINNSENVKTLRDAAEVGREGLNGVSNDIKEISTESESLLEINSVMQNIASQTNLLSMNAAIEAAHAGESGKGFAVVADEIRKLAENSSNQSKTIGTVLKKIKSSIDKITISTGNVLNKFEAIDSSVRVVSDQEEIIRRAMEEQGEGSKLLLAGTVKLNNITHQVQAGADEMRKAAQEVIRESKSLEQSTQEITAGMNEMSDSADQINLAVNHVNEISGKNREAIDTLIEEVSLFKVE